MSSKNHVPSSITTSQMSTASHLPSLSLPKKIHSISNMQSKITSSIPPPPPLLRIPNYQTKPNYTQTSNRIPTQQSSPQPSLDISQYPIQTNETPNLTSHLINLLKAPSSVPVQSSKTNPSEMSDNETQNSFLPLTLPNDDPGMGFTEESSWSCGFHLPTKFTIATLGWESSSIILYTWTGSSIKPPTLNSEVTLGPVNWDAVYPESSCKISLPLYNGFFYHCVFDET